MTLVSTIIQDAYRESNLIAVTAAPTSDQSAEALRLLNRLIQGSYGNEAGDQLNPIPIGVNNISRPSGYPYYNPTPFSTNWYVPPNSQLMLNITAPLTVWLAPNPQDGTRFALADKSNNLSSFPLTVNANGRTIENSTTKTYSTNGQTAEYMYRADIGNWFKTTDLDYSDDMPFPEDFDDYFTIGLAFRLNPRYQQAADPQTVMAYKDVSKQFKARYRQVIQVPSELGLIKTPGTLRDRFWGWGNDTGMFNAGQTGPYGWWN